MSGGEIRIWHGQTIIPGKQPSLVALQQMHAILFIEILYPIQSINSTIHIAIKSNLGGVEVHTICR